MKQFRITGMSCAACSARVEKAVRQVPGVTQCAVNLLTNSMQVEGTAAEEAIIGAVEAAGYGVAAPKKEKNAPKESIKARLVSSLIFLAALLYLSMGHSMLGLPLPAFLANSPAAQGLAQLLLTAAVMVINQKFFTSGFRALWRRSPNMDSLVALGASAAFIYSVCLLFAVLNGQSSVHGLYFESAAMILTLITVGKLLETRAKGKTTDALQGLMKLTPQTAVVERDGAEQTIPAEQVKIGDIFVVRPGQSIPADGVVLDGSSAVNEAALTGESIPAEKNPGDTVRAATVNRSGFLRCKAEAVGEDTVLSRIIRMVTDAAAGKAPIARLADKVSGVFVPVVLGIALVTAVGWLLAGRGVGTALERGICVLVISCPCALGLATPVAIMVGSGVGARNGILFKTAAALEQTGKTQIVVLDKTGTVTEGKPKITDILPAQGISKEELLCLAASLEQKSEHPLASAILEEAMQTREVTDFEVFPGGGLSARLDAHILCGGNLRFMKSRVSLNEQADRQMQTLAEEGKTPLLFGMDGRLLGIIAVADRIKPDSAEAIARLHKMGIQVVMLTGDNALTARAIGKQAGVDEVIAQVLPHEKAQTVQKLRQQGAVAMVGDGINDAPALTAADTGIAIGAGADLAIDAADAVLMKSSLRDVPAAICLSRGVLRNIRENLFWAFCYNVIGIPLAAGLFGWQLSPMFGAAAMSLSSFCVVSNALRLNLLKIHPKQKEKQAMKKMMKIEGIMCAHCEARIKKALEALDGVSLAEVSHETGTAVVTLSAPVENEVLKNAVEVQDYRVLSVE